MAVHRRHAGEKLGYGGVYTLVHDADVAIVGVGYGDGLYLPLVEMHGDILVRDVFLPGDVRIGDVIAVPAAGAYSRSMASNYNHTPRPAVVGVRDGKVSVILRRETLDDLLALDAGLD